MPDPVLERSPGGTPLQSLAAMHPAKRAVAASVIALGAESLDAQSRRGRGAEPKAMATLLAPALMHTVVDAPPAATAAEGKAYALDAKRKLGADADFVVELLELPASDLAALRDGGMVGADRATAVAGAITGVAAAAGGGSAVAEESTYPRKTEHLKGSLADSIATMSTLTATLSSSSGEPAEPSASENLLEQKPSAVKPPLPSAPWATAQPAAPGQPAPRAGFLSRQQTARTLIAHSHLTSGLASMQQEVRGRLSSLSTNPATPQNSHYYHREMPASKAHRLRSARATCQTDKLLDKRLKEDPAELLERMRSSRSSANSADKNADRLLRDAHERLSAHGAISCDLGAISM